MRENIEKGFHKGRKSFENRRKLFKNVFFKSHFLLTFGYFRSELQPRGALKVDLPDVRPLIKVRFFIVQLVHCKGTGNYKTVLNCSGGRKL